LKRILIIRGGAIGDFILTLPALRALRDADPNAHIEILGYKHIAALADNRFYAQTVRSIEYAPLASFFARNSELPVDLANYLASFDLIVSYLYDPDRIFETNLRQCGVEDLVIGPGKLGNTEHAAQQLARPLEELDISVTEFAPRVFPSEQDRHIASELLRDRAKPIIAFHPGSGSETKNWPLQNWIKLGNDLLASETFRESIVVLSGEADETQVAQIESLWKSERVRFAKNLPLPHVAAVLEQAIFVGHDSGISHLAAAAGANCILLFGPTDPEIWAPRNENVFVVSAPDGDLRKLNVDAVRAALDQALMRIGIRT
jgi:heptosyltransferase-3